MTIPPNEAPSNKGASGNTVLEGLERDAREGRIGLWADPQPVPPWEWRKQRK